MLADQKIFVVTGANKGLGRSIVKLLCSGNPRDIVYLTSRNTERGQAAVAELTTAGFFPSYHQLDITDQSSIETFRDFLVEKYGGIDALINNAGIAFKINSTVPFSEQAKITVENDFFGTFNVCNLFLPILKKNARVVNISAETVVRVYPKLSDDLKTRFLDTNLSINDLHILMRKFIEDASCNKLAENGWPQHAYGMAKIGINFLTVIQQRECSAKYPDRNIFINCCCPGTVDTDMTGGKYPHAIPPDQAADTPIYLACLPKDTSIKGCFVVLREIIKFPKE